MHNVPWHLQSPGHKTQPVQQGEGECEEKMRGTAGEQLLCPQATLDSRTYCKSPNFSVINLIFKTLAGFQKSYRLPGQWKSKRLTSEQQKVRGICSKGKLKFGSISSPIFSTGFYRRRKNVQLTSFHCKSQINVAGMNFDAI